MNEEECNNYTFTDDDTVQCCQCEKIFNVNLGLAPMEEHFKVHKKHPNLKLWYSDNGANGVLFSVASWDEDLECEECNKKGSYYFINEKYKVGCCEEHGAFRENCGRGKLFCKIEIVFSDSLEGINPTCPSCVDGEVCDDDSCNKVHCLSCIEFRDNINKHGFELKRITSKVEKVWVLASTEEEAQEIGENNTDLKWKDTYSDFGETIEVIDEDENLTRENYNDQVSL